MKRHISILIAFLLAFTLCIDTAVVSADELKDLDKQIKEKKAALKEGKKKEKEMMQDIVDLESTIDQLDGEIDNAEADLDKLTRDLEKAKKKVRKQNKDLSKRLRNMYKYGSVGFLDVLLNSGSFSDFLTNLVISGATQNGEGQHNQCTSGKHIRNPRV